MKNIDHVLDKNLEQVRQTLHLNLKINKINFKSIKSEIDNSREC